jgi:hypothetical protein
MIALRLPGCAWSRAGLMTLTILIGCGAPASLVASEQSVTVDVDAMIGDVSHFWSAAAVHPESISLTIPSWVDRATPIETQIASANSNPVDAVEPVQMLAPQFLPSRNSPSSGDSSRTSSSSNARASTARRSRATQTPYMIGDNTTGTCTSFAGLLLDADLAHPSLACSRLNISENNTPLPTDRFYFSYRHFHNTTRLRYFQFSENFNTDRFTLGGEHTFLDGLCSVEVRLPIEGRVTSDLFTIDSFDLDGNITPFVDPRRAELSNISTVFKMLLWDREEWAMSAGLGITLPTAEDFHYSAFVLDTITYPPVPGIGVISTARDVVVDVQAANETIYLAPFLSWLYTPKAHPRFFHQGFVQVEVAANPSSVKMTGDGFNTAFIPGFPPTELVTVIPALFSRVDLHPQTLMRLNLGVGYTLRDNPQADWLQRLVALAEVHYSTTLEDAKFDTITAINFLPELDDFFTEDIVVGNSANRTDIVNIALGLSGNVGNWVVTNGFVAPIRDSHNRGFDFEYNLQLQRPF